MLRIALALHICIHFPVLLTRDQSYKHGKQMSGTPLKVWTWLWDMALRFSLLHDTIEYIGSLLHNYRKRNGDHIQYHSQRKHRWKCKGECTDDTNCLNSGSVCRRAQTGTTGTSGRLLWLLGCGQVNYSQQSRLAVSLSTTSPAKNNWVWVSQNIKSSKRQCNEKNESRDLFRSILEQLSSADDLVAAFCFDSALVPREFLFAFDYAPAGISECGNPPAGAILPPTNCGRSDSRV